MQIRLSIDCPTCDRTIYKEIDYDDESHLFEVNLSDFACQEWECQKCGCFILTPDEYSMYQIVDDGEDPEADD